MDTLLRAGFIVRNPRPFVRALISPHLILGRILKCVGWPDACQTTCNITFRILRRFHQRPSGVICCRLKIPDGHKTSRVMGMITLSNKFVGGASGIGDLVCNNEYVHYAHFYKCAGAVLYRTVI